MNMKEILSNKPKKVILLGNEAIVRGALEAGVNFVSTFPGTPASEIGDTFAALKIKNQISKIKNNFYFEYSTNEKVALEAAAGAAFSGLKSLVAMKHFGLNVASDALLPVVYTGVEGAMVVVVADDPGCWSSAQTEQDTRYYAEMAHLPMLEPSNPQECKDFTKLAFEISEKFKIPVMVRTTIRVAHQSAPVLIGKIANRKSPILKITRGRFSTMPPRVLEMKKELLEKLEKIRKFSEGSKLNQIIHYPLSNIQYPKFGVIASGISYLYVMEAVKELGLKLPVLKLGFTYPLPEKTIRDFIKNFKKVLVVEELEPFLEVQVRAAAKDVNPKLEIFGSPPKFSNEKFRRAGSLPKIGELKPEYVLEAISEISKRKSQFNFKTHQQNFQKLNLIERFPNLCPGCPYWVVFSVLKEAAPKNTIFGGDIGCYMLAGCPPHNIQDWLISMGSSIGVAHGISKIQYPKSNIQNPKVITIIGDSTFFHAGIPALINTVFNKSNPLIIILDNSTTGMTGHQPHPGVGKTGQGEETRPIKIEDIVSACGVKNLKIVDSMRREDLIKTIKEFLEKKEVSVIIARSPCIFIKS